LGVIEVSGVDNASFLQGQLSNDVLQLSPTQARLAAFCSAKGRMQASFVAVKRENGDILLVCSKDLLAATLKRLSMFVMRAKAKLRDASSDFSLYGLKGPSACLDHVGSAHPWQSHNEGATSLVQLYPAQGLNRQLWLAPTATPSPTGPDLPLSDWHYSEVMGGVATVSAPLVDAFVPQMLNFESVGGVSFKKGCYPGQEVVARSQFRGTLKRRAYLVRLEYNPQDAAATSAPAAPLFVGQEVYCGQDPGQPIGLVVQAAHNAAGQWVAIVSIQTSAAKDEQLFVGRPEGPAITMLPLPYALLEDI
jgi:folate-binding protein YgfZ